jgi:hypothetical protein
VLARLDALPGVDAARVDSSGRFFWLTLDGRGDAAAVTEGARGVLGAGATPLPATAAATQLAASRRGDPWLTAREVMTLSYVESRLLSVRLAGEARRQAGVGPAEGEEIAEAIRAELFAAMERVHREGGRASSGWIHEEWPAIAASAAARCAPSLAPEVHRRIAELLPRLLAR